MVTPKQTTINGVKSLLTTFFTHQQLSRILDTMAENIYANKPFKESFDALTASVDLTASQVAITAKARSGLQKI
ncbi:hypothetical protein GCM10010176_026290 [Nonomuraea spiralis]|nr:hypothetical protein GCM10010176_026290 [Nonomuraea spiralis]